MKKFAVCGLRFAVYGISAAMFLSGCLIRTYTLVKDRVDQEVSGNQGYLTGSAPSPSQQPKKVTQRATKVFEVELSSPIKIERLKQPPKPLEEERKSIEGSSAVNPQEEARPELPAFPAMSTAVVTRSTQSSLLSTYIVQKNDTLQKISARPEIYGTTKKWMKIYKANQDKLKTPNSIRPGQELKIPRD